ncbi:MAG: SDR family oxidoreductase [Chitinophagaceae bacterium]|nr:MAG: SDR family oxidoreductase [Chitinophagaceae bacterium]
MNKVLLFGSTGNLGKKIAEELRQTGYDVTGVVRNERKAAELKPIVHHIVVADVTKPDSLKGICDGYDVVISALGKSVSPNDRSKPGFREVDLNANSHILDEAVKSNIKKFVYVSAFHAECYQHLAYFAVHHQFSERLKQAGIDYSIIKPPALFSAFLDLINLAKKGRLITMGNGDKLTNPIYEGDLATICVESIHHQNAIIEAGGKEILSRQQINEIIQQQVDPSKQIRNVPLGLIKSFLPLMKVASKNLYDKMAFFTEVMQHDTIAPKFGEMKLEEYVKMKLNNEQAVMS